MRLLTYSFITICLTLTSFHASAQLGGCGLIRLSAEKDTLTIDESFALTITIGSRVATPQLPLGLGNGVRHTYEISVEDGPLIRGEWGYLIPIDQYKFSTNISGISRSGMKKITVRTNRFVGPSLTPPDCSPTEDSIGVMSVYVLPPPPAAPTTAGGFTGLWWNPNTDGQGVFFTQNSPSNIAFIGWFTYDANGVAKWYVGDRCAIGSGTVCTTTLYEAANGKFDGINFNNAQLKRSAVGEAIFSFTSSQAGEMIYNLHGVKESLPLVRQPF